MRTHANVSQATRGSDHEAMKSHMEGANYLMAYILRSNPSSVQSSMGRFVTEIYAYNACLASFTVECPTLATLWPDTSTNSSIQEGDRVGMLCGCAQDLFTFVPRVSTLLSGPASREPSSHGDEFYIDGKAFVDEYWGLRSQISSWKPTTTEHDIAIGAELYQYSLLLLLDTRFQSLNDRDAIQNSFERLKSLFLRLPSESPIATTATWPLFVFGMNAYERFDRELVRQYMNSLIQNFGMGIMETSLAHLEKSWKTRSYGDTLISAFANRNELILIC
jgi:hypothetical protein